MLGKRKPAMENQKSTEDINVDSFPLCLQEFFPLHLPVCCEVTDGPRLLEADLGLEVPCDQKKSNIACCIFNWTVDIGVNAFLEPVSYYQYSSDTYFALQSTLKITNKSTELSFKSNAETETNHSFWLCWLEEHCCQEGASCMCLSTSKMTCHVYMCPGFFCCKENLFRI